MKFENLWTLVYTLQNHLSVPLFIQAYKNTKSIVHPAMIWKIMSMWQTNKTNKLPSLLLYSMVSFPHRQKEQFEKIN
jgi:hypothetical protein